ncbi:HPP family protein [Methylobacterium gnaphalii]|uniref:Membrane protein n=1 Tax=Methylobacterium gnaphalii TaxID=1010610 RepID=A0A512JLD4_9HYPH|nr:HPP family protein [Methylobacterium gnaphalii]GEP10723.1 membrane protein [Methylobacterium gnaphalii]GJD67405.1 Inosine-5'-monophosphate dehydrogenase [Methylobacterium gnaphalii]GLS49263.1 membrane protein [Methylobacterium gnaphalii]
MANPKNPTPGPGQIFGFQIFRPILAGATLRERLVACLGALIGIALTGLICGWFFGDGPHIPLIVAPMGASAVLLFAVPASPLAQPWSIIGGNTISAFMGVVAARFVPDPIMAIGVGVSLAIAAMSLTRSLHPPGGAAALTALIGGHAVTSAGFWFPLFPVCINSLILVALGIGFHKISGRNYPHVAVKPPVNTHGTADIPPDLRVGFRAEDVDAALTAMNETLDIDRSDLDRLLRQVELQALVHTHRELLCEDVMSRDVITIAENGTIEEATALLLDHNIRTLPVVDRAGRILGTVGLRELANKSAARVADVVVEAKTAAKDDPAVGLVQSLTDGRTHAIIIVSADRKILGVITQTDLLATLARQSTLRAFEGKSQTAAA